ncbi:DNA-3-methyladenine glycosylase 2 family protein [Radiobacillus kanasensis]|uniref:DNA-3-methyladenine glycosylase family protein n=1 Tax=Radiobacillus kanasensis TaxID=2844358 RepID=UPI001E2E3716|nr:DNA-3-methyladenine glycosylase 2 family protein [Radiobacillus kanasensis]UFU00636.1 DNA-3-methyladenine glycosylase 2 family protein [Radiobacillus kanasensis]
MGKFYFTMEDDKVQHLINRDPILEKLIRKIGTIHMKLSQDYYRSIVQQIIGQQLSLKAAATIIGLVEQIWSDFNPELIGDIEDEVIRGAGVSKPKIKYIRDLTDKHLTKEVDLSAIHSHEDAEVLKQLTSVKGIGKWTAEMFLIFSLARLDVLSYGDVSIQNAIRWLYQIEKEEPLELDEFKEKWAPYNSVASLYLWEAINRGLTKNPPNL